MPMYEYACEQCQSVTEALRRMDQADDPILCDDCGSTRTKRVQSVFAAASGGTSASDASQTLPMAPCGRCGDPRGSCGLS